MHAIRGMVQVQANQLNLSHDKKQFYADLNWLNSLKRCAFRAFWPE